MRSSVDAPPEAPRLRPSVAPSGLLDLPPFELPVSAAVEACSINSSVCSYASSAEAGIAAVEIPPSAPRFCPSHPPFDLGRLPPFDLPPSFEVPYASETSSVKASSTSSRSANAVRVGRSAGCHSVVEAHRVPPLAPLLKPVAFVEEINSQEMPSLELPPAALGPSGGPRLGPSPDPFDLKDLPPLELPVAMHEMPSLAPATSPSSFDLASDEENALATTDRADVVLGFGPDRRLTSFDEIPGFRRSFVVERHGEVMKCDVVSVRGRSSSRNQASRVDKNACQQKTDSRSSVVFSWSTFPLSLKRERELSPSTVSTSASDFAQ
eukprot:TRINITY_DN3701_c0_g1_i1.p1 TRINITY_DN3701_c0_g1~~TRINITY_DN3701_c0_g1_i1.p1  ORF type:complete len:323 (-),score=52.56 TRINITY_DN3701_c0_g1_i1:115-1083(-)